LGGVRTQKGCEAYVREFMRAGNPSKSLLVLVDIRAVGAPRVNAFREIVDAFHDVVGSNFAERVAADLALGATAFAGGETEEDILSAGAKIINTAWRACAKHVVVCIYIPTTWAHIHAGYPSLFLHGWDFLYLDSHSEAMGCVSAANWMKVACGFQRNLSDGCAVTLRALNKDMLKSVVMGVTATRNVRHFQGVNVLEGFGMEQYVAMEAFYMLPMSGYASVADRLRALEMLEAAMGHETLCSLLADRFLALFSEEDIIRQLLSAVSRCTSGESAVGLTAELNRHLRAAYEQFARHLYHKAAHGYNLQSLFSMYDLYGTPVRA